jgi:predicted PurR-regulated permease PerM
LENPDSSAHLVSAPEPEQNHGQLHGLNVSAAGVLAALAVVAALYLARSFVVPLLIGILASYTLFPLVDGLQRLRIPRVIGAALVLGLIVGALGGVAFSLRDDAQNVVEKLPEAARKFRQKITSSSQAKPGTLQQVGKAADELQRAAAEVTGTPVRAAATRPPPLLWLRDYAIAQSALLIAVVAQAPLVILLAYFLLASGEHFRRKLLGFVGPSLSRRKITLHILHDIDAQVQRYMLVSILTNVLVGIGTWLSFEAMGISLAGLWGTAAGVMHFIPYLGPTFIAVASGIAAFMQFDSVEMGIAAAAVSLLVAALAGMVFMTWLQSRVSRTNPAVLFISLLFFGWLWGAWGLLLGAPLLAIGKVICDRVDALNPLGEFLGR